MNILGETKCPISGPVMGHKEQELGERRDHVNKRLQGNVLDRMDECEETQRSQRRLTSMRENEGPD